MHEARAHLKGAPPSRTRRRTDNSYIFVMDTVAHEDEPVPLEKGQQVRTRQTFEQIFAAAELVAKEQTPPTVLHEEYLPAMVWALY